MRELNEKPARHVVSADGETASGRGVFGTIRRFVQRLLIPEAAQGTIGPRVRVGAIGRSKEAPRVVGRVEHARRLEDVVFNISLPGLTGPFLDKLAGCQ